MEYSFIDLNNNEPTSKYSLVVHCRRTLGALLEYAFVDNEFII